MVRKIVIKGAYFHNTFTAPSLNSYLQACGMKPVIGANLKRQFEGICAIEIRKQLLKAEFKPPVCLHYKFYEPAKARTRKRDCGNILAMFDKVFADAFVKCGYIPDDGPKYMRMPTGELYYTDDVPYIEIYIEDDLPEGYQPFVFSGTE